jgi:hypothetical protein
MRHQLPKLLSTPRQFWEDLQDDIVLDELVDYFLFEGTPHFFRDWEDYCGFRTMISDSLDVSSQGVALVGSGRLGYSVSPDLERKKIWREFDTSTKAKEQPSDIDVVVVDQPLFDKVWRQSVIGEQLTPPERTRSLTGRLNDKHKSFFEGRASYWDIQHTSENDLWQTAFRDASAEFKANCKGFLFRDWYCVRLYYRRSFKLVRKYVSEGSLPAAPDKAFARA